MMGAMMIGAIADEWCTAVSLYTILPSPILYDACHKRGGVGEGACIARWACTGIAIG